MGRKAAAPAGGCGPFLWSDFRWQVSAWLTSCSPAWRPAITRGHGLEAERRRPKERRTAMTTPPVGPVTSTTVPLAFDTDGVGFGGPLDMRGPLVGTVTYDQGPAG